MHSLLQIGLPWKVPKYHHSLLNGLIETLLVYNGHIVLEGCVRICECGETMKGSRMFETIRLANADP